MSRRTNKHGRRPGRGVRPWLLMPKVLSVAVYFGSTVAAAAVWFTGQAGAAGGDAASRLALVNLVGGLLAYLAVPALVLAMLLGAALWWQAPGIMIRQRWLQVKLGVVALGVPTMHLFMASRVTALRLASEQGGWSDQAAQQLSLGLGGLIAGSAVVIVLSRLKPRLGQNWARAYARHATRQAEGEPAGSRSEP